MSVILLRMTSQLNSFNSDLFSYPMSPVKEKKNVTAKKNESVTVDLILIRIRITHLIIICLMQRG